MRAMGASAVAGRAAWLLGLVALASACGGSDGGAPDRAMDDPGGGTGASDGGAARGGPDAGSASGDASLDAGAASDASGPDSSSDGGGADDEDAGGDCEPAISSCALPCGTLDDGCGHAIPCGTCDGPFEQCLENECACVPETTECPEQYACGTVLDECGSAIPCGTGCTVPYDACVDHACVCQAITDVCPFYFECGSLVDECGDEVICAQQCPLPNDECIDHSCYCTRSTCDEVAGALSCGSFDDGCGSTVDCGCDRPRSCVLGGCLDDGFGWLRRIGAGGEDWASAIATHGDGSSVVTGYFHDTVSVGSGNLSSAGASDVFVVKYGVSGNVLWARRAGGADADQGSDVAVHDDGSVAVVGSFRGTASFAPGMELTSLGQNDTFVARYDSAGALTWLHQIGGADLGPGFVVDFDDTGAILVGGNFRGTASFDADTELTAADLDIYVAKYDSAGDLVWTISEGGPGTDAIKSIDVLPDGRFAIGGQFSGAPTFGEAPSAVSLAVTAYFDGFVAAYDANADLQWVNHVATTGVDGVAAVLIGASGEVYATGDAGGTATFAPGVVLTTSGTNDSDQFVVRYDAAGTLAWLRTAGGSAIDEGRALAFGSSGDLLVAGQTLSAEVAFGSSATVVGAGSWDVLLARYDLEGGLSWAAGEGGVDLEGAAGIAPLAGGGFVLAGSFMDSLEFGGEPALATNGGWDAFVARFDAVP